MDSNIVWWFVGGLAGGVVGGIIGKSAFNFIWSYYDNMHKLNLSIVDIRRELGEYMRKSDLNRSYDINNCNNTIRNISDRVTALEKRPTK